LRKKTQLKNLMLLSLKTVIITEIRVHLEAKQMKRSFLRGVTIMTQECFNLNNVFCQISIFHGILIYRRLIFAIILL